MSLGERVTYVAIFQIDSSMSPKYTPRTRGNYHVFNMEFAKLPATLLALRPRKFSTAMPYTATGTPSLTQLP